MKAIAVMGLFACVIAGCSALPTAGPTASDVKRQEVKDNQTRFNLVDIDDNVVAAVSLSDELWVVLLGVSIGILTMRFAAGIS